MAMLRVSGEEYQVRNGTTVEEAVTGLDLHPDSYLYLIGGRPVPMDTVLQEGDVVKAVRVASGG